MIALSTLLPFSSSPFKLISFMIGSRVDNVQSTPIKRTRSNFIVSSAKHLSMIDKTLALLVFSHLIVERFCTPSRINPASVILI